jgi:hypothetical protein
MERDTSLHLPKRKLFTLLMIARTLPMDKIKEEIVA